jgi:hypothetical protein
MDSLSESVTYLNDCITLSLSDWPKDVHLFPPPGCKIAIVGKGLDSDWMGHRYIVVFAGLNWEETTGVKTEDDMTQTTK